MIAANPSTTCPFEKTFLGSRTHSGDKKALRATVAELRRTLNEKGRPRANIDNALTDCIHAVLGSSTKRPSNKYVECGRVMGVLIHEDIHTEDILFRMVQILR